MNRPQPKTIPEVLSRCHALASHLGKPGCDVHFNTLSGWDGEVFQVCVFVDGRFACGSRDSVIAALEGAQGHQTTVAEALSAAGFEWRPYPSL
jgi:hypothetical protein